MNQILELREKRAKAWEAAKAFLDSKRNQDGFVSAEDAQTYEKMEEDVIALGKEIERLERQAAIDLELAKPTSKPITNQPGSGMQEDKKTGLLTRKHLCDQLLNQRGLTRAQEAGNNINLCHKYPSFYKQNLFFSR